MEIEQENPNLHQTSKFSSNSQSSHKTATKTNFYVKHELEIINYTLILGISSYIGIYIQNNIIEQVAVNQSINDQFQIHYSFIYLIKILARILNMNYFLRSVSHEKRVQWSIALIFLSNMILAFAFSIWVTTDSRS